MYSAKRWHVARTPRRFLLEPTLAFHKVWRAHNREANLGAKHEKRVYLNLLNEELTKQTSPLHAVCLMRNHSHEIYTLKELSLFSNFMRQHHSRYGVFFNRRHRRCGKVAQARPYTSAIENEHHEMIVTFYVHANPVRAGIVRNAKNYLWSTHRLYAFGVRANWMKNVRFPKWYMALGRRMKERKKKYRQLFDAYLRRQGIVKVTFPVYGVGDPVWMGQRRIVILQLIHEQRDLKSRSSPPS